MIGEVTSLLQQLNEGDASAHSRLIEILHPELRRIADNRMRTERADHTLQPTALVNEFFLQCARRGPIEWRSRAHFLAAASEAMRRLLIDYARAHRSEKRGGSALRIQLDEFVLPQGGNFVDAIEIGEALDQLSKEEPRMARVVELHCFGGSTFREIGEALSVDERTAKRDWQVARAWLVARLRKQ
jgi:RNA polymerase sigma factor (TIGR02999 family)